MSKVLVTGGAGFIGFHLAKRLLELGHQVSVIDNLNDYYSPQLKNDRLSQLADKNNFSFTQLDLADQKALADFFTDQKFDLICHLAAQAGVRYSFTNPLSYINSNIIGTFNLLEQARQNNIPKIIFASSSSVYGNSDKESFSESDPTDQTISLYAATKKSGEALLHHYYHNFNINAVALRFFTVYGPWGRPDMAYFKFTRSILEDKPIEVYNNGDHLRDFTYIDDIVEGIIKAIDYQPAENFFEVINLGHSKPIKLKDFIATLEDLLQKPADKKYLPMQPGDVYKTSADISKAQKLLNWQPTTDIKTGLKNFVDWYKDYYKI